MQRHKEREREDSNVERPYKIPMVFFSSFTQFVSRLGNGICLTADAEQKKEKNVIWLLSLPLCIFVQKLLDSANDANITIIIRIVMMRFVSGSGVT